MKTKLYSTLLIITVILFVSSCTTYSPLPYNYKTSNSIDGIYLNDPCINPFGEYKLWDFIHNKSSLDKDSLRVSLKIIGETELQAKLFDGDKIVAEKILKVKIKEDSCYYTKRKFYIIPILPILFAYSNSQKRFVIGEKSLLLERTVNSGGAVIIMANGEKFNDSWEYKKSR